MPSLKQEYLKRAASRVEIDMKFAMKSLVAAAALAAVGVASAATITATVGSPVVVADPAGSGRMAELKLISGTGALTFSNGGIDPVTLKLADGTAPKSVGGMVAALNTGGVKLGSVDGASVVETKVKIGSANTRAVVQIGANVSTLTADTTTGVFSLVTATGGASQTAVFKQDTLQGGVMEVKNIKFDLTTNQVFADMKWQSNENTFDDDGNLLTSVLGPVQSKQSVYLWDITTSTGPVVLPPAGLLAAADGDFSILEGMGYKLLDTTIDPVDGRKVYRAEVKNSFSGLKVTEEGFNIFNAALGLGEPGAIGYDVLAGVNSKAEGWGRIDSTIIFTAKEVPEPSTYALMGLGLVGISLVARRRAK
jgi:PEP-CTERM motif